MNQYISEVQVYGLEAITGILSYTSDEGHCGHKSIWNADGSELSSLASSAEDKHFEKVHSLESVIKDIFQN